MKELVTCYNIKKYYTVSTGLFSRKKAYLKAVDNVSLKINKGEVLGLVGESGSGKTTLGLILSGLINPSEGDVFFEGKNIFQLSPTELRMIRKKIQIIFQDPFSSLNPRMTVGEIISEPIITHERLDSTEALNKSAELLEIVGLKSDDIYKYPHEFSGGQAQRIAIARALSIKPSFIVADEPVSSLDVSVRAQILNLLKDLQIRFGLTYLFISHDLSVVRHISNRIGVMYLGKIVEIADKKSLFDSPIHPYTQALLSAAPIPDPSVRDKKIKMLLKGEIPSPLKPPEGCRFHSRCPYFRGDECKKEQPLIKVDTEHYVACTLAGNKH